MVITILGASGFIGSNLYSNLKKSYKIKKIDLRSINLLTTKKKLIFFFFNKLKDTDYIINCCASLKPETKDDFFINSELPSVLQKTIYKMKKKPYLIHFSTLNVFIKQRTDTYTSSKIIAEKKLDKNNTTIIRLPLIINNNKNSGNLKILYKYLNLKYLPIYPMIYPGHIYKPIHINKLCNFFKKFIKLKKKNFTYNLVGDKKISFWDIFEKIAKKKNKRVLKLNTNFLNLITNKNQKNRFIRNNDFLSQLFSIDQSSFNKITLTKL